MRITVVGAGYIGVVTSACLAELGHEVVCCDLNPQKVSDLRDGTVPFFEPGLQQSVRQALSVGNLLFSDKIEAADSKVVYLTAETAVVGGACDTTELFAQARASAASVNGKVVFAVKATVPPGTCDTLQSEVKKITWHPVEVVADLNFARRGLALEDFTDRSRIALGTDSSHAIGVMTSVYGLLSGKIHTGSSRDIEASKYACSLMLSSRISVMNEIAAYCDKVGADIETVRQVVGSDPRIGSRYLRSGVGFSGASLQNDLEGYIADSKAHGLHADLGSAFLKRNHDQIKELMRWIFSVGTQILGHPDVSPDALKIAIWGLAFKAGTDDIAKSAGVLVAQECLALGCHVAVSDPEALMNARKEMSGLVCDVSDGVLSFEADHYAAAIDADILLVLTDWPQYRQPDWERLAGLMRSKHIYDGRNMFVPRSVRESGFAYRGVGRVASA